jgi:hypothetical protein
VKDEGLDAAAAPAEVRTGALGDGEGESLVYHGTVIEDASDDADAGHEPFWKPQPDQDWAGARCVPEAEAAHIVRLISWKHGIQFLTHPATKLNSYVATVKRTCCIPSILVRKGGY